jgi:hypothetical protein
LIKILNRSCGLPTCLGHPLAAVKSATGDPAPTYSSDRSVIGPDTMMSDNMMWARTTAQRVDLSPIRKILAAILEGVPDDEQAKPAPDHDPGIAGGNTARVYNFDVARLTVAD